VLRKITRPKRDEVSGQFRIYGCNKKISWFIGLGHLVQVG
jgi:hypothetical protein